MSKRPSPVNKFRPTRDLTNVDPTQLPPTERQSSKAAIQLDRRKFENGQPLTADSISVVNDIHIGGSITLTNYSVGSSGDITTSGSVQAGSPIPPSNLGDGQFGATVPSLPHFYVSSRELTGFSGPTNYHPGASGSAFPRMLLWDDPLLLWFSSWPVYHSGGIGLTLDKTDATLELPHVFNFAVSGNLVWGFGCDADTVGTGGHPDYILAFDYSARGGLGADLFRGCPASASAYGVTQWNWGAALGTPRGNSVFFNVVPYTGTFGYGLNGMQIACSGGINLVLPTQQTSLFYDKPQTALQLGYGGATNRSINLQQLLNASTAKQYVMLNGAVSSGSTTTTPKLTSSFANSFGIESTDTTLALITAPVGTDQAVTRGLQMDSSGGVQFNQKVGFNGNTPIAQPAVSGSVYGNPAVRSLCQGLASLGLFANNTTSTDPTTPAFSWVNQGSATITSANGTVFLTSPAASGDSLKLRVITAPTGTYTITMGFLPALLYANFLACGLCLYDSGTGKIVSFELIGNTAKDTTGQVILASKWTTSTSFSADYTMSPSPVKAPPWQAGSCMWFQLQDDGTTRHYRVSNDGINFIEVLSTSNTDFLTPTNIGFFVNPSNTIFAAAMNVVSWQVT